MLIWSLSLKRLIDVLVIQKIFQQQNWGAYSLLIFNVNNLSIDKIENKHILKRGKDCMKNFCESLRQHAKI